MNDLPGIGHNQPTEHDKLTKKVDELKDAANAWITKVGEIDNETQAEEITDFKHQVQAYYNLVDKHRMDEKRPYLDAAKAVDRRYDVLVRHLVTIKSMLEPMARAWLQKKRRRQQEALRKAQDEARRRREEAEAKAAAAEEREGDVIGKTVDAHIAQKKAAAAERTVKRAAKAKPTVKGVYAPRATSLRPQRRAEIKDIGAAVWFFRDEREILEAVQRLANALARRKDAKDIHVDGVLAIKIVSDDKAA